MEAALRQDPATDDRELVLQAQRGVREAFVELVRLHHEPVRRRVARQVGNVDVADDLAQEVFLAAYRGLSQYNAQGDFRAWLFGIARNKVVSYLRSESARRARDGRPVDAALLETWSVHVETAEDLEDERHLQRSLLDCVDELAAGSRQLVQDFYFNSRSAESIARELGRQAGAVRMSLLRIRRALAACLERKQAKREQM